MPTEANNHYPATFEDLLKGLVGEPVEVRLNNGKSVVGKLLFKGEDYILVEYTDKSEIKIPAIPLLAIDYVI